MNERPESGIAYSLLADLGIWRGDALLARDTVPTKRYSLIAASLALLVILVGCGTVAPDVNTPTVARVAPTPEATASLAPSAPPKAVTVPHVKGKTATGATWRLESAGFKVRVTWAHDSHKRGRVIAQKPSGGKARPGSTVLLTVSTGAGQSPPSETDSAASGASSSNDEAGARAFQQHKSGIRLTGSGVVTRVLPDDNDGSRHQRFILRLSSGQTLLVAHNIDIAPRLPSLAQGDSVAFSGIYEWSSEGGTVHWTHRDPGGQHAAGRLKYKGRTYR